MVVPDAFWEGAPLGWRAMAHLAASIRLGGAESLSRVRRPADGKDLVGQLAQALREYFCAQDGVMNRQKETMLQQNLVHSSIESNKYQDWMESRERIYQKLNS